MKYRFDIETIEKLSYLSRVEDISDLVDAKFFEYDGTKKLDRSIR